MTLSLTATATATATVPLAVRVRDLRRAFGEHAVLDGLDLDIAPGEVVALLGRSGTGKSTLLRILAGLDDEVTGEVLVAKRRTVVFQEPRLLPWSRVVENVRLGLKGRDMGQRAAAALGEVGLIDKANAWPVTLSGGEAQRASLARALVREPELLLLDEPFGALDALTRLKMHALLGELLRRHQPSVLLVTHDVDEAIVLAGRVLVLDRGRLIEDVAVDPAAAADRASDAFRRLRTHLLGALGVDDRPIPTDIPKET
jgi:sulfonate transport system ATP-binding protein